ncbi:MAG: uracil-DNA glycosylase family protein [Candidatus Dojkabacteria bacterium]|jgi:uracil-DNA glycosylase
MQKDEEQELARKGIKAIKSAILQCRACNFSAAEENRGIGKGNLFPIILFVGKDPEALKSNHFQKIIEILKLNSEQWAATYYFKCPIKEPVTEKEFKKCSKFFGAQIYFLKPQAIIILGDIAMKGVTSRPIENGEIIEYGFNHWLMKIPPLESLDSPSNIKKQKEYLNEFRRTLERRSILPPVYH